MLPVGGVYNQGMKTVTITIGLNSNATLAPLPRAKREAFMREVRGLLSGSAIFAEAAPHDGSWTDEVTGQVVHERSRTWVAGVEDTRVEILRSALGRVARRFEQDAIAFTVGDTDLV